MIKGKLGDMQQMLGIWVILGIMFLVAISIFFVYKLLTKSIPFP